MFNRRRFRTLANLLRTRGFRTRPFLFPLGSLSSAPRLGCYTTAPEASVHCERTEPSMSTAHRVLIKTVFGCLRVPRIARIVLERYALAVCRRFALPSPPEAIRLFGRGHNHNRVADCRPSRAKLCRRNRGTRPNGAFEVPPAGNCVLISQQFPLS